MATTDNRVPRGRSSTSPSPIALIKKVRVPKSTTETALKTVTNMRNAASGLLSGCLIRGTTNAETPRKTSHVAIDIQIIMRQTGCPLLADMRRSVAKRVMTKERSRFLNVP